MVERGGGLGFALKTLERLMIARQFVGQKFQRDETVQLGVFGFVDHAHSAAAQLFEHAVMGDGASGKWLGICHGAAILGWSWKQGKSWLDP